MSSMEPDILGRLVSEQAAALVLYARQWCAAPEDVVQEAFVKLMAAKPPPQSVVPWLYRVVRNLALTWSRSARRRHRHECVAAKPAGWFEPAGEAGLDAEAAAAGLHGLPVEQREVIIAHVWGGLTFEQIGEVANCSASTAHRWYVAGLTSLRERLGVCPTTLPNEN